MVSRRHRARFFSKAAPPGSSRLSLKKRRMPLLRYVLLIVLICGGVSAWSFWGGQMMASINPDLRLRFHLLKPALDAWITPPEYTGLPPIMIATPAGPRFGAETIEVPVGSTLTAHLGDSDGGAPSLLVGDIETAFDADPNGGYAIARPIAAGDTVTIRRGWQTIDSWHIKMRADAPPTIAFKVPPSITARKAVEISYDASDEYGVSTVVARITPESAAPRAAAASVEILLATPSARDVHRVNFEDLTTFPWAGSRVHIQLIASDFAGHTTATAPVEVAVPARVFLNPVARALVTERDHLIKTPEDEHARNEAANVMAGVAHMPGAYQGDPVVLMALRSGAVRLVLDHDADVVPAVEKMLWETAIRVEDGNIGVAERQLHEVQGELADALDRKAAAGEVDGLIARLREALAAYIAVLAARDSTGVSQNMTRAGGTESNMLPAADMQRMLKNIQDLSATGDQAAAHDELLKFGQRLEDLRAPPLSFSEEMRKRAHAQQYPDGTRDQAQHTLPNF